MGSEVGAYPARPWPHTVDQYVHDLRTTSAHGPPNKALVNDAPSRHLAIPHHMQGALRQLLAPSGDAAKASHTRCLTLSTRPIPPTPTPAPPLGVPNSPYTPSGPVLKGLASRSLTKQGADVSTVDDGVVTITTSRRRWPRQGHYAHLTPSPSRGRRVHVQPCTLGAQGATLPALRLLVQ